MNAPENTPAAYPINLAHEVLLKSDSALCVEDVARAIVGKKPTKADIKPVAKLLKELADLGLIEMEPRAGGVPFYRLIVASEGLPTKTYPPETLRAMVAEHEGVPFYRLIVASESVPKTLNEAMPGFGAEHQEQRIDSLTKDVINTRTALTNALNEANRLRAELAAERQAREALQEQDGVDVKDAAVGYLVRVTKRKPRYVTQPDRARDAALAAVRAGAGRAEVLAVVPVGVARRGAEWQGIQPRTKGD